MMGKSSGLARLDPADKISNAHLSHIINSGIWR